MSLGNLGVSLAERGFAPDALIRMGMRHRILATERLIAGSNAAETFAHDMPRYAIAEHSDTANAQHYELPPEFFAAFLGPRRKYSCCYYPTGLETLAAAEEVALQETADHADLQEGQDILELGCGWGSLSLWMAERFPSSRITAISNSAPQRLHIQAEARARGLENLTILTSDMNDFGTSQTFDRVVSVEMFEHMTNWKTLLTRTRTWLKPDGLLFLHVFAHRMGTYRFDHADKNDWIAQHFFTGGIMPSHDLIRQFPDIFNVSAEWRWSGAHYQRTALQWLENFDRNRAKIDPLLRRVYGKDADLWRQRWRMFLIATAEMFGFGGGDPWGVSHYRLVPRADRHRL